MFTYNLRTIFLGFMLSITGTLNNFLLLCLFSLAIPKSRCNIYDTSIFKADPIGHLHVSVHERVYDSCTVIGGARGLVSNFFKPSCLHFCLFKACSHCSVKEGREGGGVDYPTISENIKQPVEVTC